MPVLINAYSTLNILPELKFPHKLNARRDRRDPELQEHLNGFIGYVLSRGEQKMTHVKYHLKQHIERVKHHVSISTEQKDFDAFSNWAWQANAICFMEDSSVRDPSGRLLIDQTGTGPDAEAQVPYPPDARSRKARSDQKLQQLGIRTLDGLPPVIGETEVEIRPASEVARRALALFVAAVRAELLAANKEKPVAELRNKFPLAFEAFSPKEKAFFAAARPEQQQVINFAWGYEAVFLLQWALGSMPELSHPAHICDVPAVARAMVKVKEEEFIGKASLRPVAELLDALDLHFRINWAVTQSRLTGKELAPEIEAGVVAERHRALNWLVQFENSEWDEVKTPT
jgi:hypothetical protein